MNDRIKNICILVILTLFLLVIEFVPVTCLFKQVTGISCPACGMTRAFHAILNFNFVDAFYYNILSIPLFIFIISSFMILIYETLTNRFEYFSKLFKVFSNKFVLIAIFFMIVTSFVINNI